MKKMGVDNIDVQQEVEQMEPIAPSRANSTALAEQVRAAHMAGVGWWFG